MFNRIFRNLFGAKAIGKRVQEDQPNVADATDTGTANAIDTIAAQSGDREKKAVLLYDGVIARGNANAESHYKRANALNGLGRWGPALADYDRAIALDPGYANAHCNRGAVLERLNRLDDALTSFDRAIALNSGDFLAYYNRGSTLKNLGRLDAALDSYDRAIELKNDYAEAYINRGNVLQELERHEAAIESYDRAIQLTRIFAEAFQARGTSLASLRRFEAAIESYSHAIDIKPDYKFVLGMRRNAQMQICDWHDLENDLERLKAGIHARRAVCSPFSALALVDSAELQRSAAEIWVKEQCPPNDALAMIPPQMRRARIRIGYFSADFYRTHPVPQLTAGLFQSHDRSRFETTAFAFGPGASDATHARMGSVFDRFIDVRNQSDIAVSMLAREIGIDIAVDLGGFTEYSRPGIFALRAAPLQVNYLGYPGTMGAEYMDYLIGDRTVVPEAMRTHYAERIVYLPGSYLPHDPARARAERIFTRTELGLPPTGFVFCCFNNSYKITPNTFECWMRILGRTENSVLWLSQNNPSATQNLRKEALRRGIDPKRLIFAERMSSLPDHLARHGAADLFIDTRPYNAHATAIDALWAGLPVLTFPGEGFAARVAASLLNALGLPELIASTPEQYEESAVRLAENPQHLKEIRRKLAQNRVTAPLFDAKLFTTNLERAYTLIYERFHANLAPDHIALDSNEN